jgi:pre-mRNA-splicing helicase BRR2
MKNKKKKGDLNEMQKIQIENNKILEFLGFEPNFISRNLEKNLNSNNIEFIGGDQNILEENIKNEELHPVKIAFGDVGYNENIEREKEIYEQTEERKNNYTMIKVKPINKKRNKIEPLNVNKVLPKWAQKCFNFQFFNEIQSKVFDKSFNSDDNMLITAPTGAGKTNIALMTILREIGKELRSNNMNNIDEKFDFSKFKWELKVLFLVPLKALANEFLNKFKEQLGFFNLVINEFSGDVDLTKNK